MKPHSRRKLPALEYQTTFDHEQPLTESQLWGVHQKYDRVVLATKPENNIDVFSPITLLPSSMDFKSSFSLNLPKYKWAEVKAYLDSHPDMAGKTREEAEQWRGLNPRVSC